MRIIKGVENSNKQKKPHGPGKEKKLVMGVKKIPTFGQQWGGGGNGGCFGLENVGKSGGGKGLKKSWGG